MSEEITPGFSRRRLLFGSIGPGGRCRARQALSFFDGEEIVDGNVSHGFDFAIRPVNFNKVHLGSLRQAVVKPRIIRRKIAPTRVDFIPLGKVTADDPHASPDGVTVFAASCEFDGDPVVAASAVIPQNGWLTVEI